MATLISDIDPWHPVTCGLHVDSLIRDNGLRVDEVFREVDWGVMHGYPMYADGWSQGPLDPDFVPYLCALTSALSGKPTLMEEFGGCTNTPGEPSSLWEWTGYGLPQKQFMASEEDLATYIEEVLPRPPCSGSIHERFFGLVRPDGSLKPHAEVLRRFAATNPTVRPARRTVTLDITPDEYYREPHIHAYRLYQRFLGHEA
jgi:hypothetical protein